MLQNLPLEILDKIFGYMKLKDQCKLAQVNEELGKTFGYHVREKYKYLRIERVDSEWLYSDDELEVILSFGGSSVHKIIIPSSEKVMDQLGDLIKKYCTNLRSAMLVISNDNFNALKPVLSRRIEDLVLICGSYDGTDVLQYVNPYCKALVLTGISMDHAQHIRQLTHLEKLDVTGKIKNIFEICSHLPKLRELRVDSSSDLSQIKKDYLYPELEKLNLTYFEINSDLPICPKLKTLTLDCSWSNMKNMGDIIAKYGNTLERFQLYIPVHGLVWSGYAEQTIIVLKKCKRLQFFSAKNEIIHSLFDDFMESFITILKENGFNTERRLRMNGGWLAPDQLKQELMEEFPNSEVWNMIEITPFDI